MSKHVKILIFNAEGSTFCLHGSEHFSAIRKSHWQNSRLALTRCLIEMKYLDSDKEVTSEDIEISEHHHLKKYPDLLVSLSHTREVAAAILAQKSKDLLGVGIDIEKSDRLVKPELLDKFQNDRDEGLDPLELWCAKEAAFKASSYFWKKEKTFVLKDIGVTSTSVTAGDNVFTSIDFEVADTCSGTIEFSLEENFLITTAFVKTLKGAKGA